MILATHYHGDSILLYTSGRIWNNFLWVLSSMFYHCTTRVQPFLQLYTMATLLFLIPMFWFETFFYLVTSITFYHFATRTQTFWLLVTMAILLFLVPVVVFELIFLWVKSIVFCHSTAKAHNDSGYQLSWQFYSSLYQWWDMNPFSLGCKSYVLQLYHQGTTILATLHYGNSTILNAHVLIQNFFTWLWVLCFTTLPLGHNHSGCLLPWELYSFWYQWWYSNPFFLATPRPRHNDSCYPLSWRFCSSRWNL